LFFKHLLFRLLPYLRKSGKKEGDIESSEVQEKSRAALEYCKHATEYTTANEGKPWQYVLIPHNAVKSNMGFEFLVDKFKLNNEQ